MARSAATMSDETFIRDLETEERLDARIDRAYARFFKLKAIEDQTTFTELRRSYLSSIDRTSARAKRSAPRGARACARCRAGRARGVARSCGGERPGRGDAEWLRETSPGDRVARDCRVGIREITSSTLSANASVRSGGAGREQGRRCVSGLRLF